jgi:hypothetical protein
MEQGNGGDGTGLASEFPGEGDRLVEQPGRCTVADSGSRFIQAGGEGVAIVIPSPRSRSENVPHLSLCRGEPPAVTR